MTQFIRSGGYLYIGETVLNVDGQVVVKREKLMPTTSEDGQMPLNYVLRCPTELPSVGNTTILSREMSRILRSSLERF